MSGKSAKSTALGGKANSNSNATPKRPYAEKVEDLDITKDEFDRISNALKNEEFRKLFLDYCAEIQDPENRALYEKEIIELEAERGVEVRFLNPEPGFVIKTSADGQRKCFVNVAHSREVAPPTSVRADGGAPGLNWSIPLAQSAGPGRDDLDAQGKMCRVYDVIFHPDALQLAHRSAPFRKCLIDTAMDAVERQHKVKLDRVNLKFPKLKFKGVARPTILRRMAANPSAESSEPHPLDHIFPARPSSESADMPVLEPPTSTADQEQFTTPSYVLKHRRGVDLSEYTDELDAKFGAAVPHELVVEITLPLLASAAECTLDVTERQLYLFSEKPGAMYRLQVALPYAVDEPKGRARFDTDRRRLDVTLPVQRPNAAEAREARESLLQLHREDSGVESDVAHAEHSSDLSSSTSTTPSESTAASPTIEAVMDLELSADEGHVVEISSRPNEEKDEAAELETLTSTWKDLPSPSSFLKPDLSYRLPEKFDCNALDDALSVVLHVRNVQPDSVELQWSQERIHLQFLTLGGGFYPTHYAFCLQLSGGSHKEPLDAALNGIELHFVAASAEAWQNNVVLSVELSGCSETLQLYWAGLDAANLQEYALKGALPLPPTATPPAAETAKKPSRKQATVAAPLDEDHDEDEGEDEDDGEAHAAANAKAPAVTAAAMKSKKQKRKNKKRRSYSESACDDLKAVVYQHQQQQLQQQQQRQQRREQQQQQHQQKNETARSSTGNQDEVENIPPVGPSSSSDSPPPTIDSSTEQATTATPTLLPPPSTVLSSPPGTRSTIMFAKPRAVKQRSYSESRSDCGLGSSAGSVPPSFKGILKRYSRYGTGQTCMRPSISDSCSSIDDYVSSSGGASYQSYSCSADGGGTVPPSMLLRFSKSSSNIIPEEEQQAGSEDDEEDDGNGLSESCKKTVRFNEVIQKQLFKMDSSILGQRKKNQKRRDRKQRAIQRRLSEGDSADYDEKPLALGADKHGNNNNNDDDDDDDGEHERHQIDDEDVDHGDAEDDEADDNDGEEHQQQALVQQRHNNNNISKQEKNSKITGANNDNNNNAHHKGKKTNRNAASDKTSSAVHNGKARRPRLESESSSDVDGSNGGGKHNGMMFEMDM